MNVAKYIRRDYAPRPTIHENEYIEEFKHPAHFSIAGAGRPLDGEISGGKQFAIHKSEKIPLDDFAFDAHERIRGGEHPWDVYGSYGAPLDLPIENKLLYNPNNLTDKDVFVARWQEEEGTTNAFTQRLENILEDKSLTKIREEERGLQSNLRGLDAEYKASLQKLKEGLVSHYEKLPDNHPNKNWDKVRTSYGKAAVKKSVQIENIKSSIKTERTHPRSKIVVEPAYAAAAEGLAFSTEALAKQQETKAPVEQQKQKPIEKKSPMDQRMEAAAKRLSKAKKPAATPPSSGKATAGATTPPLPPPPASQSPYTSLRKGIAGAKTHKRTDSGESEMSDITSAAAESFSGTPDDINSLVDIGDYFSKSAKLDQQELTQIQSRMKKVGIYLPPNTKTQKGLIKKYKEYIEKHHVMDRRLAKFSDL